MELNNADRAYLLNRKPIILRGRPKVNQLGFFADAIMICIKWGDGTVEYHECCTDQYFEHKYERDGEREIKLYVECLASLNMYKGRWSSLTMPSDIDLPVLKAPLKALCFLTKANTGHLRRLETISSPWDNTWALRIVVNLLQAMPSHCTDYDPIWEHYCVQHEKHMSQHSWRLTTQLMQDFCVPLNREFKMCVCTFPGRSFDLHTSHKFGAQKYSDFDVSHDILDLWPYDRQWYG
jgi:hypothetical protein